MAGRKRSPLAGVAPGSELAKIRGTEAAKKPKSKPLAKRDELLSAAFKRARIDPTRLTAEMLKKVHSLLEAKESRIANSKDGVVINEVDAPQIQLSAARLAGEILQLLQSQKAEGVGSVQVIVNVPGFAVVRPPDQGKEHATVDVTP